jgi:iron complex transport system substrate-binding protein
MVRCVVVAAALVCAAGCARREATPKSERVVVDTADHTVRLPAKVERIVSLAPSVTEILFAVGAGPKVVGVDRFSSWPPEARKVEVVGSDLEPSLERIVALRPDVVFSARTANPESTVRSLERLGISVYVSHAPTVGAVRRDIVQIGEVVGRRAEAEALSTRMEARIEALRGAVSGDGGHGPLVLVVVWPEPMTVAGPGSFVDELLRHVGARNLAGDAPVPFPTYGVERVIERQPDVIIVGTHAAGAPPLQPLERLPVPAAKNRRIHLLDGDLLFRPGPRLVEGAEALVRALKGGGS